MVDKKLYDQNGKIYDPGLGFWKIFIGFPLIGFLVVMIGVILSGVGEQIILLILIVTPLYLLKVTPSGGTGRVVLSIMFLILTDIFSFVILTDFLHSDLAFSYAGRISFIVLVVGLVIAYYTRPEGQLLDYKYTVQSPYMNPNTTSYMSSQTYQQNYGPQQQLQYQAPMQQPDHSQVHDPVVIKEQPTKQLPDSTTHTSDFIFCSNCGEKSNVTIKFCGSCGNSLH